MTEEARIVEQKRGREDVTPNTPGLFENVITGKSSMVALPADALQSNQVQSYSANSNLSPRYTFDNFVVGNSNQVAVKVSWMVAEGSNQSYNPILLVGGTGTGKTHLLNAIGQYGLQL